MLDVDIDKLNECATKTHKTMRTSLISMALWDRENAIPLAGYNPSFEGAALFNRVINDLERNLNGAGYPELQDWFMVDLDGDNIVIVLRESPEFMCGILIDGKSTNFGLLLNVVFPMVETMMREARNDR